MSMSVCNLIYPACKAHAPYYIVVCDMYGCTTIHCFINGSISGKKSKMCVLIFSKNFPLNISHSKKNVERYCHKCT